MPLYAPSVSTSQPGDIITSTNDTVAAKTLLDSDFVGGIYTVLATDSVLIVKAGQVDPNIYFLPSTEFANKRVTIFYDPVGGDGKQRLHIRAFPDQPADLADPYDYWYLLKTGNASMFANLPATGVQWSGVVSNPPEPSAGTGISGSGLQGEGGLVRLDGNTDIFGPNTIYIEGGNPDDDVMFAFRDGVSFYTHTGADGTGSDYWDSFIQMNDQGLQLGNQGTGTGVSTTINGGEYGITLNPGGTTGEAPVAVNGRGEVMTLNPGLGGAIASNYPGHKGMIGYFGGYMYLCVDTDTWVRAAVDTSW